MERCQVIAPVHVSRNPTVLVSPTVLYAPRFTVTPPSAPLLYKPKPTVRLADSPRRQTRKRPVLRSAVISEQHSDEDCRGSHAHPASFEFAVIADLKTYTSIKIVPLHSSPIQLHM